MRLKYQLMLVSLILLIVPVAGYEFITELENELRQNQQQLLRHTATLAANQLQQPDLITAIAQADPPLAALYAHPIFATPILDGYADDWQALQAPMQISANDPSLSFMASHSVAYLYLFVDVKEHDIQYQSPGQYPSPGDSEPDMADGLLLSFLRSDNTPLNIELRAIAPGPITPELQQQPPWRTRTPIPPFWENMQAVWQDSGRGFSLEIRLPISWTLQHLALSRLPRNQAPEQSEFGRIVKREASLEKVLRPFASNSVRVQLTDADGWILADVGATRAEKDFSVDNSQGWMTEALGTLLRLIVLKQPKSAAESDHSGRDSSALIRQAMNTGTEAAGWFSADYTPDALSVVVQPLIHNGKIIGTIRAEQMTNVIASLSNTTIFYLLGSSVLIFLGISALLIGYASWLSFRISHLRQQVGTLMTEDGQIISGFSASAAKDEIGALSQQFAVLFNAVEGYTQYLETFSQKLVHEIKTPVAIVSSSLDILQHSNRGEESQTYIQRAQDGVARISQIINALREATRLEKSIGNTESTVFLLNPLLSEIFSAYQSIDKEHNLILALTDKPCYINGSPELIAQMLDKLFDNARSHTPNMGHIKLALIRKKETAIISMENEGSELPKGSQDIFSSFVTHRKDNQEGHMGLGLVIVKLIAQYHGGSATAANLPQQKGVCFNVTLPLSHSLS